MLEISSLFIVSFLAFLINTYLFCKIDNQQFQLNKKVILFGIITSIIYIFNSIYMQNIFRTISFNVLTLLFIKSIYKESFSKSIMIFLLVCIVIAATETMYIILYYSVLNFDIDLIIKNNIGVIISNIIILILDILMIKNRFIKKTLQTIVKWYDEKKIIKLILLVMLALFLISYFMYLNVFGKFSILSILLTNLIIVGIIIFVFGYFIEKARNNELLVKYDNLFNYVSTYEKISIDKNKRQHEYKNQLIVVREMIENNDKKSLQYVEKLLEIEEKNENLTFVDKLSNIPEGGLKGFILYKIDKMLENDIEVFAAVSPELKNSKLWESCDEELQDVTRAIGVYLDNAIEAVRETTKKYIIIDVDLIDKNIVFSFSNTYKDINISKMDKAGYSTKGKDRGMGLTLISEIISKNNKLEQARELNGIYYVQKLIIKK